MKNNYSFNLRSLSEEGSTRSLSEEGSTRSLSEEGKTQNEKNLQLIRHSGQAVRNSTFATLNSKFSILNSQLLTLALFLALSIGNGWGQTTITLGTGTTTSNTAGLAPIRTSYTDARSQFLIRASELTGMGVGAGSITSLALYVSAAPGMNLSNFSIKMGTTLNTALNTTWETASTSVYSANPQTSASLASGDWRTFTFSTPFSWNGTSNILIEFCHDNSSYSSAGGVRVYTPLTGTNVSRYYYVDYPSGAQGCGMSATPTLTSTRPQFRLTFASPCSGTPSPGNTVLSNTTICSGGTTNLSLQNSVSGNNVIYNWQSSTDNSTWSNMYELVNTNFSSLPTGTNVYGASTSVTGGELVLTPNIGGYSGGFVVQNTMGVNSNYFRASFDYRIFDGGGADGMSMSFAPSVTNDAGGGEAGEGTGIRVLFDTYNSSTSSRIILMYNGLVVAQNNWNDFNLRNSSYRNVVIYVNNSGNLFLSIGGTSIFSNVALPSVYTSSDKSNWKFKFSARTGSAADKHSIDNLLITYNHTPTLSNISATSTTFYRCQVTCMSNTGTSNVGTLTVNPLATAGTLEFNNGSTQTICSGNTISCSNATSPTNGGSGNLGVVWYCGNKIGPGLYDYGNWRESNLGNAGGTTSSSNLNTAAGGGTGMSHSLSNYNPLLDFTGTVSSTYSNTQFLIIRRAYTDLCGVGVNGSYVDQSFFLNLNAVPTAGSIGTAQTICSGGTPAAFTSTAAGTGTGSIAYEWQTNASGSYVTIGSQNAATYQAPSLTSTTSYQRRTVATNSSVACYSAYTTPVTVTVVGNPAAPTATTSPSVATVCAGETLTLTSPVSGSGGTGTCNFEYRHSTNNGTSWSTWATSVSSVTAVAGTNLIEIRNNCNGSGCDVSPSTQYSWTVNPCPVITPSLSSLSTFSSCTNIGSNQQSFTVAGVDLVADIVVTAPSGFQVSLTPNVNDFASSITIPNSSGTVSNVTVYVRMLSASTPTGANVTLTSTDAVTQNVAVSGNVAQNLSAVTLSGTNNQTICSNSLGTQITASETNGGTIISRQWGYRTAPGGPIFDISGATGATYTPSGAQLPAGVSYIVCTSTPTCGSPVVSNEITVTETELPTASISYSGSPFCMSVTSASPTLSGTNPSGGTYSSTAGLNIVAGTGTINPSASTAGTYTITYTIAAAGGCPQVSTTTSVVINTLPQGSFSGNSICSGENALLNFTSTAGTGPFNIVYNTGSQNAVTSGTAFNAVPLNPSSTTTYTLTSVTDANGCARTSGFTAGSATVTVTTTPSAPGTVSTTNVACTSLTLNWGAAANASGYEIQVSSNSGFSSSVGSYNGGTDIGNVTSTSITGLTAGTQYWIRVRARNGAAPCRSGWTNLNTTSVTTGSIPTISYPGTPYTFAQNAAISNLTPNITNSPTSFAVSPSLPAGLTMDPSTGVISGTPSATQAATTYTITATNAAGCSSTTTISIAVTPQNNLCANAINLTCPTTNLAGTTVNTVSQTVPSGPSMSSFGVWYSFAGDGFNNTITVAPTGFDVEFAIWSGSCGSLTYIGQVDAGVSGISESATILNTLVGTTYYIYVAHYLSGNTTTGPFTISRATSFPQLYVTGDLGACSSSTGNVYAATSVPNSTYNWTIPSGWTQTAGTNTNQITLTAGSASGILTVSASNYCGTGVSQTVELVIKPNPSSVTATASPSTICLGESSTLTSSSSTTPYSIHTANSTEQFDDFIRGNNWSISNSSNAGGSSSELRLAGTTNAFGGIVQRAVQYSNFVFAQNAATINMSFKCYIDWFTLSFTLSLQTSTDGTNWTTRWSNVTTADLAAQTINVNSIPVSGTNFYYRFLFDGNRYNLNNLYIDDIVVTGTFPTNYTWSSNPSGFTSSIQNPGSVSPTQNTTYSVSASSNGCSASNSVAVTVNPTNTISLASSNNTQTVCSGTAINDITYNTTGATGVSVTNLPSGVSASWSGDVVTISGTPNVPSGGTFSYTVNMTGGCVLNQQTPQGTITVTPNVAINAYSPATSTRCQGAGAVTYTTTGSNSTGITYSLDATSLTGGNTINSSTGQVTYASGWSGTTTITASAAGCNGPATTTHVVTITPTVGTPAAISVASGTEPTCQLTNGSTTTTFATTASNNTGFNWSVSPVGAGTINATSGLMTWANGFSGIATISVTANGCNGPSSLITRMITVNAAFSTGAINTTGETICSGGTPTQIGSTTAASGGDNTITYSWRSSADSYTAAISGATSATYTPPAGLTTTTSYRRYAKDGTCNTTFSQSTGTWIVTVNQPSTNISVVDGVNISNGDYLWNGNTSTDGSVASNWYVFNSGVYSVASSAPTNTTNIYVVPFSVASQCIASSTFPNNPDIGTFQSKNVYIGDGAELTIANGSNYVVKGDFVNNGTFTPGTGTVSMNGSTAQSIGGSAATTFNNLEINNTAGVNLNRAVDVNGTLNLNNGVLSLGNNNLTLGTGGTISVTSPSASKMINTSGLGELRKRYATAAGANPAGFLFPIGTTGTYTPVHLDFSNVTFGSDAYMRVRVEADKSSNLSSTLTSYLKRNWIVEPHDISNFTYTINLQYAEGDFVSGDLTDDEIVPIKYSNGQWNQPAGLIVPFSNATNESSNYYASGTSSTNNVLQSSRVIGWAGLQTFSEFGGAGMSGQPLPVELVSFSGICEEGIINLTWQTASEFNSSHFDVEKSRDGENWQVLTTLPSAGTSNELITYQSTDQNGTEGNNYFRLRQVDVDGTEKVYDPINVSCSEVTTGYFSSFPNPSGSSFQVIVNNKELLGVCTMNIVDASGKVIDQRKIEVKDGINMFVINQELTPGIYFLNISNGSKSTPVLRHAIK